MFQAKLRNHLSGFVVSLLLIGIASSATYSGQPMIWETSGRAELLKGDAKGVSISDTGVLTLAPNLTEVFSTDRKSTRLNSSHSQISYAVFCLKKKKINKLNKNKNIDNTTK